MLISVVVPAHNAASTLGDCLGSIRSSEGFERLCREIIVVDDGSTDETAAIAERSGATVCRVASARGPATARNRGVAAATGDVVLFLDADVRAHHDTLARAAAHFEEAGGPAAVMGSYDATPACDGVVSVYRNLLHHYVHQTSAEGAQTFWAGCGAIRRSVFLEVGGFDESFAAPSIEDIELGYRLTDSGYRVTLDKRLQVTHLKRWTLRGMVVTDVTRRAVPWARLLLSRKSMPRDLNLRFRHRLSAALVFLLALGCLATAAFAAAGGGSRAAWSAATWSAATCAVIASLLLLLNYSLYAFFTRARGWRFALAAIPLHWLYYLYSGAALLWVMVSRSRPGAGPQRG